MEDGPPIFPSGSTCPMVLWIPSAIFLYAYRTLTFYGWLSHTILLGQIIRMTVRTPTVLLPSVWPLPLSLATTRGISVDFFSSGYLDVSVPRVPHVTLWIHVTFHDSSSWGFPHSEICGSKLICSSPQLIAACHVLHRLLMPRHSPYALFCLNFLFGSHISELLEFQNMGFIFSHLKGFPFSALFVIPPCGEIVVFVTLNFRKDLDSF